MDLENPKWYHLLLAPLMGLVYALFLPAAGLAIVFGLLGLKVVTVASDIISRGAAFGWRPAEVYLSGMKRETKIKDKESTPEKENKIKKKEQQNE